VCAPLENVHMFNCTVCEEMDVLFLNHNFMTTAFSSTFSVRTATVTTTIYESETTVNISWFGEIERSFCELGAIWFFLLLGSFVLVIFLACSLCNKTNMWGRFRDVYSVSCSMKNKGKKDKCVVGGKKNDKKKKEGCMWRLVCRVFGKDDNIGDKSAIEEFNMSAMEELAVDYGRGVPSSSEVFFPPPPPPALTVVPQQIPVSARNVVVHSPLGQYGRSESVGGEISMPIPLMSSSVDIGSTVYDSLPPPVPMKIEQRARSGSLGSFAGNKTFSCPTVPAVTTVMSGGQSLSYPRPPISTTGRAPVTMASGDSSGRVQAVLDEIRKYNERVQQYNAQTAGGHGWIDSSTTL